MSSVTDDLDDPFAQLTGPLASASHWPLHVVATSDLGPHLRRVELTAEGLGDLDYRPGQDFMLLVDREGRRPVRRRYTIRALDRERDVVTIDVVLHGDGPGERWVRAARPGVTVEGIAPRGKIWPDADADWHLFVGDESAAPAVAVMAESLPAGSRARIVLEVPDPADRQPIDGDVTWVGRDGLPTGDPTALVDAVRSVEFPTGAGHAYLFGEARVVSALRDVLASRGFPAERVSPKAYWGCGRANAGHGEPARD